MSTAKFDTLSTLDGSRSVPVNTVAQGSAKAWVNFNGTGTVSIRAAFNVTSITDNGTGDYTLNFTTALPDANYAVVGSTLGGSTNINYTLIGNNASAPTAQSASSVQVKTVYVTSTAGVATAIDHQSVNIAIFR
jgi:hypothetical protein